MTLLLLLGGGSFAFLVLLFFGLGGDEKMSRRLARVGSGEPPKASKKLPDRISAIRQANQKTLLDRLAHDYLPNIDKLRQKIARTGKPISLSKYVVWMVLSAAGGFVVFKFFFSLSTTVSVLAAVITGLYLPFKIVMRMGDKRIKAFIANFPEAIDTMCRGLRSGLPVTESINAVGRELPDPVGEEFRKMADAMRLGQSMDEAMWDVAKRIDIPEFRFLIISMAIQRETGGNLAETLGNLADLLRRRRQLKMKIRAMSSEARASAMIIGSLPFVMFLLLFLVSKPYVMTLINTDSGNTLLMIAGGWMGIGVYVMKQMIDFEI
ncbi:MAG: type II secretion system F family protein [Bdellovibrionales bacterium]